MIAAAFIGALALAIVVFEISTILTKSVFAPNKLAGATQIGSGTSAIPQRSTWEAVLIAIFPRRFDPQYAGTNMDVVDLIRRAGYPYDTPGAFYAAAIRYFTIYLVGGAVAAGVLAMLGLGAAAPFIAAGMIYMGLTRPYANLRSLAKKRSEAVRNNMLLGLSVFESLLADMGPTNALQKVSTMGGPFCNLLMLYVSRSGDPDVVKNINIVRAHIPDPADINMMLFLRDLQDHFVHGRTILESVAALRVSVQREILEATEKRTSLILQRTSLFGIFSVVGLILSLILPFMLM